MKHYHLNLRISCVLLGCVLSIFSSNGFSDTLQQVVVKTFECSPDLLVSEAQRKEADQRLNQAYAGYLPSLDLDASIAKDRRENTATRLVTGGSRTLTPRSGTLRLTQMVFDGLLVKNTVDENLYAVKSSSYTVFSTSEAVALQVAETYLEVLRRQELRQVAKRNLLEIKRIYEQIETRTEGGLSKRADQEQATSRLALAQANLIASEGNLRDAVTNYIRVVGCKPVGLVRPKVPGHALPECMEVAVTTAFEFNPILRGASIDVCTADARNRQAKAAYFPTVDIDVNTTHDEDVDGVSQTRKNLTAGLRLTYNLFRGGADLARDRETAYAVQASKFNRAQVRREIEQNTRLAWNFYITARSQVGYFQQQAEAALQTRRAYEEQFRLGQRTLLDLLDSESELFSARSDYVSAQYTELLGRFRILNAMGQLTSFLGVRLPCTAYFQPRGVRGTLLTRGSTVPKCAPARKPMRWGVKKPRVVKRAQNRKRRTRPQPTPPPRRAPKGKV